MAIDKMDKVQTTTMGGTTKQDIKFAPTPLAHWRDRFKEDEKVEEEDEAEEAEEAEEDSHEEIL